MITTPSPSERACAKVQFTVVVVFPTGVPKKQANTNGVITPAGERQRGHFLVSNPVDIHLITSQKQGHNGGVSLLAGPMESIFVEFAVLIHQVQSRIVQELRHLTKASTPCREQQSRFSKGKRVQEGVILFPTKFRRDSCGEIYDEETCSVTRK